MELAMRIHFCKMMQQFKSEFNSSQQLANIYTGQVEKIEKTLTLLHEDLRSDFQNDLDDLYLAPGE
jgi:hypothetical protein